MITGKRFENQLIAAKEAEYLNCYYNSDNFLLSDAIEYYSVIFKTFLKLHEGRFFQKLDSVQKEKIYGLNAPTVSELLSIWYPNF